MAHLTAMGQWAQDGKFIYTGRQNEGGANVRSGECALFLAVIADRSIKGSGVYRTLLIWPYAVAPAVAGVLWLFMFNKRVGVVSWYLGQLGYDWNHVLNGGEAMGLVVVASSWGRISYNFLFFFAALQAVPKSVIEAAAIDGAHFWKRFWTIVLPLLSPTPFFLLVVNIVYSFFETFGVIHTITAGGPQQTTTILVYKVYSDGFRQPGSWIVFGAICNLVDCRGFADGLAVQVH